MTGHGHKKNPGNLLYDEIIALFGHQNQILVTERISQRERKPAAVLQLLNQRGRNMVDGGGDHNGIKWSGLRPPEISVTLTGFYVVVPEQS